MKKLIDLIILRKTVKLFAVVAKLPARALRIQEGKSFVMTVIKRFGEQPLNKRSDKNGCTRKFKVS